MSANIQATISKTIHAPAARVWQTLTSPAAVKEFMFGADIHTDWQRGSAITYTGEWQGNRYEDKGNIIDIQPNQLLHTTYWSSMGGTKADVPENYCNVIYRLHHADGATTLTIMQDGFDSEEQRERSLMHWNMALDKIKEISER